MIGNDIIDLALAKKQSNWQRKGLIDKLFTVAEQHFILDSVEPEARFWNLWSRKEAAYKIHHRETKTRAFNPKGFSCVFSDSVVEGKVIIDNYSYWTKTLETTEYVYTEAVINRLDFDKISAVDASNIAKDKHGIPFGIILNNPVSITHHGRFQRRIQLNW